jgi:GNAT superfamily N-acetyltransferase
MSLQPLKITVREGVESADFEKVTAMLSQSYWSPGISIGEVRKGALNSSLVIGAFLDDHTQVGYARVISDRTRFAYILDVYVEESYRHQGIARQMIAHILAHAEFKDVYQWMLITKDAHGLYGKVGFKPLAHPANFMEIRKERPQR